MYLAACMLNGQHRLLGIVDSGASNSYVTAETRKRADLEPTGRSQTFMCIHGMLHKDARLTAYRGLLTLGTRSGSGTVYEIDARLAVGGLSVGAVLGRDVLRNFNVALNWLDGTGFLEDAGRG
ncbi:MAG: hypothetical protein OXU86_02015 [Thaumarchaeota archaeon]|nr:hypothetical protein [Nitrososphaerota archaeon]